MGSTHSFLSKAVAGRIARGVDLRCSQAWGATMTNGSVTIEIGPSGDELFQPSKSARLLEPFTRQLLLEAGLKPGMRVLDVCSGAGDVALLTRNLVGREGSVVGFDSSGEAVAYANARARTEGSNNLEFIQADIQDLPFDAEFDAIVGRIVLAYRDQPVRDLRALLHCLKPGGVVVFQELDHLAARTIPPVPLIEQVREWFLEAFKRAGSELQMGPKLYAAFRAAGLRPPQMRVDALIGGSESAAPTMIANVVRKLLPQMEALGVATAEDVQIDTLEERMRIDLERAGAILQSALLMGAWTRLPG